jgi:hypothetical protein
MPGNEILSTEHPYFHVYLIFCGMLVLMTTDMVLHKPNMNHKGQTHTVWDVIRDALDKRNTATKSPSNLAREPSDTTSSLTTRPQRRLNGRNNPFRTSVKQNTNQGHEHQA